MCRIVDLRCKEVINICDGTRFGCIYDVELDTCTGQICSIVVPGPCRFFGLFGRGDDIVIPWNNITKIGDDIILVQCENLVCCPAKTRRRYRNY